PVQPCTGPVIRPYRVAAAGPAEHGLLALVRARDREPRPAQLRGARLGYCRSGRGCLALGQCVPADGPPGRATAFLGRPGPLPLRSRGDEPPTAPAVARRDPGTEPAGARDRG